MEDKILLLDQDEVYILRAALIALEQAARSDEPHYAHTDKFGPLVKKVRALID